MTPRAPCRALFPPSYLVGQRNLKKGFKSGLTSNEAFGYALQALSIHDKRYLNLLCERVVKRDYGEI